MATNVIDHQASLENAFRWVEFAYQQGNALLEAMRGRLAESGFPSNHVPGFCGTQASRSRFRYVWLDCSWYLPGEGENCERAAFVTLSYASEDRRGCHLIAGVAELDGPEAGLLEKPKKETRHWLLDEALNLSDYPNMFDVSVRDDGLVQHTPLKAAPKLYHSGLKQILSAPFPVAWVGSEQRLVAIVDGLVALFEKGDGGALGKLSREAVAEATPDKAG